MAIKLHTHTHTHIHTHTHTHTHTAMVVMGLQIAIAVLGRFREARLDLYVSCLESSLQQQLQPGEQIVIPENATFPVSQCTM